MDFISINLTLHESAPFTNYAKCDEHKKFKMYAVAHLSRVGVCFYFVSSALEWLVYLLFYSHYTTHCKLHMSHAGRDQVLCVKWCLQIYSSISNMPFSERRLVLYSLSDSTLSFCMFTHCSSNALVTYKEYSTSMIDAKMYSWWQWNNVLEMSRGSMLLFADFPVYFSQHFPSVHTCIAYVLKFPRKEYGSMLTSAVRMIWVSIYPSQ